MPQPEPQGRGDDPLAALIGRETAAEELPGAAAPARRAEEFIGQDVAVLDSYLGDPGLVRREGRNEFRRYDLKGCRVFAVVAPAGGLVQTVATGPLVSGEAAPSFSACTRAR